MTMSMRAVQKHECPRCGMETASNGCCDGCERDLEIHREKLLKLHRPFCGTCGDTGQLPEKSWPSYGIYAYEPEAVICDACPRCDECGADLREHSRLTGECP